MSKYVRVINGTVCEMIPPAATVPSIAYWYGEEFASECAEASDEVLQGWVFNPADGTFSAPSAVAADGAQTIATLKRQLSETDYKIIKCSECSLAGLVLPYDIVALHTQRQTIRDEINTLEAIE